MISRQEWPNRIQNNVGVPWQSERSDGILLGSGDQAITGIATTYMPTLDVLRRAVASGKNTIICREAPFYSRGERAPLFWRNGPAPPKKLIDNDAVCRAKQEFISRNNLVIIRLFDNRDARKTTANFGDFPARWAGINSTRRQPTLQTPANPATSTLSCRELHWADWRKTSGNPLWMPA
jgi:hypothetical protein